MKKLCGAALLSLAVLAGCGGGSSKSTGPAKVNVTVIPSGNPVIVGVNLTQQFTASVSGISNQAVTWSVSGSSCTGSACGTISSTGLFTAPATPPTNPSTVTVTATSQVETKQFRSINVRIVDILVSVLPGSAMVALNGKQQFTASSNPAAPVTWSISGKACSPSVSCGTVSSSGLYTAPASLPNPTTVTVTATSTAEGTATGVALITLLPATSSRLKGNYAFHFSGFDTGGALYSAGTFFSDGLGNISAGVEDVNGSAGLPQSQAFTGTYTIGQDNRGTLTLNVTGGGTFTYDLAIGSSGEIIFIESDSSGTRGSGIIDKADPTQFFNSKIAGPYVMGLFGSDQAGKRVGLAGLLVTDGASPNGVVTSGSLDINDAGTAASISSLAGTYGVGPNGRGTMTVTAGSTTYNFSFYVVSASELFLVSTDTVSSTNPRVGGLVVGQSGTVFNNSFFNGNGVFNLSGVNASAASVVAVGILATDGNGNVTSSSVFDENNAGQILSQQALAGNYSVASNGRGTISLTGSGVPATSFVLYTITNNKGFLLDMSGSDALSGFLEPQITGNTGVFSPATLQGAFITGTTATSVTGASTLSGVFTCDGSSSISGTEDETTPSGNTSNQALAATYTVASNGRGTMSVTAPAAISRVLYVVNGSKFVTIESDSLDTNSTVIESER